MAATRTEGVRGFRQDTSRAGVGASQTLVRRTNSALGRIVSAKRQMLCQGPMATTHDNRVRDAYESLVNKASMKIARLTEGQRLARRKIRVNGLGVDDGLTFW